jgi:hypothetical protein
MLAIRCTATPNPKPQIKLPKRVARVRRVAESKRMDTLRSFHDSLKKTAQDETQFLKDFFDKTNDMWSDEEETSKEVEKFDLDEE